MAHPRLELNDVRKRWIHLGLGIAASVCALAAAIEATQWWRAHQVVQAVRAAQDLALAQPAAADARARLARALALGQARRTTEAQALYRDIAANGAGTPAGRAALYNAANLLLRQAIERPHDAAANLPLLERAKRDYRAVLRADPQDWDARHNLELALRLAPEDDEPTDADNKPAEVRRIPLPGMREVNLP